MGEYLDENEVERYVREIEKRMIDIALSDGAATAHVANIAVLVVKPTLMDFIFRRKRTVTYVDCKGRALPSAATSPIENVWMVHIATKVSGQGFRTSQIDEMIIATPMKRFRKEAVYRGSSVADFIRLDLLDNRGIEAPQARKVLDTLIDYLKELQPHE